MIQPHAIDRCPSLALTAAVLAALGASLPAQAQFVERPQTLPAAYRVASGDVDGDGDIDLAFANRRDSLLLNDGRGEFVDVTATHMPARSGYTGGIALGDVDGDGDLDMVSSLGSIGLYRNDGRGVFADETVGNMPAGGGVEPVLGDVDGDGDLDLVLASGENCVGAPNRLLLNDGTGRFREVTGSQMPANTEVTYAIELGDVDGDGDLDMACANTAIYCQGGRLGVQTLYLNDGHGSFHDATATHMPGSPVYGWSMAMGDVDGDHDLDLIFADLIQNEVYLNDGTGHFRDASGTHLPAAAMFPTSLALGDVDADGAPDLVFGTIGISSGRLAGVPNPLYGNDGSGVFVDVSATRMSPAPVITRDVALADLDGDGDLDLICANDGVSRIYTNLLGQLEAPAAPAIGQPWQLDLYARWGTPRLFDVALPFVSLGASRASSPFGEIGIDLTVSAALPALLLPPASGAGSAALAIPADPQLVGQPLYAQALVVSYPQAPRLTNVVRGTIR